MSFMMNEKYGNILKKTQKYWIKLKDLLEKIWMLT